MHAWQQSSDVLAAGFRGALTAPVVTVADPVEALISAPSVGDHGGSGLDIVGDEVVQRRGRCIWDDAQPATSESLGFSDLHGHSDQPFLSFGSSARQTGVCVIN